MSISLSFVKRREEGFLPKDVYTIVPQSKITKVEVDDDRTIRIFGNFGKDFSRFEEGIWGSIQYDERHGRIRVDTEEATSLKMIDLFNAIFKFEPKFEPLIAGPFN